jgi:hypothetical protein
MVGAQASPVAQGTWGGLVGNGLGEWGGDERTYVTACAVEGEEGLGRAGPLDEVGGRPNVD